jgi:hypothetical protein
MEIIGNSLLLFVRGMGRLIELAFAHKYDVIVSLEFSWDARNG